MHFLPNYNVYLVNNSLSRSKVCVLDFKIQI